MPNHRDRGYALMHKIFFCVRFFVVLGLLLFVEEGRSLINRLELCFGCRGGLVVTLGTMQNYDHSSSKAMAEIRESVMKANFQTSLIAFFVFASYFATKGQETSRLFLVFYLSTCWPLLVVPTSPCPVCSKD